MSFVVYRTDMGLRHYYAAGAGLDYANVGGAWIVEKHKALRLARRKDADDFLKAFISPFDRPHCDVEQFDVEDRAAA